MRKLQVICDGKSYTEQFILFST